VVTTLPDSDLSNPRETLVFRFSRPARRRRALAAAIVAGALTLALGACGSGAPSGSAPTAGAELVSPGEDPLAPAPLAAKTKVTVAVTTLISSYGAFFAAKELGEFEKENLEVDVQVLPVQDAQLLLNQGRVDVALSSVTPGMLNLISQGGDVRAVFPGAQRIDGSTQGWYVRKDLLNADGTINQDKIKGAALGAPGGSGIGAMGYFFNKLRADGLEVSFGDIKFQNLTVPDSVAAIERGALDIAYASAPYNLRLADKDCCSYVEGAVPQTTNVYTWFGSKLRTEDPEVGQAFTRAMARTVKEKLQGDYRKDDAVMNALGTATNTPVGTLKELEPSVFDPNFDLTTRNLQVYQGYYRELGAVQYEGDLDNSKVFDDRFIGVLTK
jgi:NitT/TauT family transport system substrate-binding protein